MPKSLLLVEDDGLIRMDLAEALSDMGYDVAEAANADEALEIFHGPIEFDGILTDIDMPGSMNGIALAHQIATQNLRCCIIIISGRYHPGQGKLPEGASYLGKPVSQQALEAALKEAGLSS
jgi:two-component system, response regulator PdtaR